MIRARVRKTGHKIDKLSQEGLFGKMTLKLRQNDKIRQLYKDQGQGVPGKGKSKCEDTELGMNLARLEGQKIDT